MKAKIIQRLFDSLMALGKEKQAHDLASCSKSFRVFGHLACGALKVYPIRCNHPLCPVCAGERTAELRFKVNGCLESRHNPCRFLTLTVKNVSSIDRDYVDWLIASFKRLRSRSVWARRVLGGVYAIDTTYNRTSGTWHVHLHVLIEIVRPTERERRERWFETWTSCLREEWKGITGSWVIHLRAVDRRAVNELIKYSAKAATFVDRPDLVAEYLSAFHNVRRIQTFGTFFRLDVEADDSHAWDCDCGRDYGFDNWVKLLNASRDDVERDENGQYRLRFGELWWEVSGREFPVHSPPIPDSVVPVAVSAAQFEFQF